jgi:hypothetical protein
LGVVLFLLTLEVILNYPSGNVYEDIWKQS